MRGLRRFSPWWPPPVAPALLRPPPPPRIPPTARSAHHATPKRVPAPTPFVPDVRTFLLVVGRNLKQFADKIPTWEALFTLTSDELRELGVNPARSRRYLLHWLERFRNGQYGPGGDFGHVSADGVARLAVGRDIRRGLGWVINVPVPPPPPLKEEKEGTGDAGRSGGGGGGMLFLPGGAPSPDRHVVPAGYHVRGAGTVVGPHALPNRREIGGATVKITEGMWENRRGQKLDGGERRRASVRAARSLAARVAQREAEAREAAGRGGM